MMKEYEIIDIDDKNSIVFYPSSLRFFLFEKSVLVDKLSECDLLEQFQCEKVEVSDFNINNNILPRLVINISNDCNLRCRYCYANGGNYLSDRRLMNIEILKRTLDLFFGCFDHIESIQLFGGEPSMNIDAIEYVCKYIKDRNCNTEVGMVTNGTILNNNLMKIIDEYKLNLTISVDIELLHDNLRPFSDGRGSYNIIKNNIKKLKKYGQPSKIEVTYTQKHIKNGISIHSLTSELKKDLGVYNIHLAPVSSDNEEFKIKDMGVFGKSVDDFFNSDNMFDRENIPYSLLLSIISSLKSRTTTPYVCFAGFGTISVSCEGDVYPCFYFHDNEEFKACSVNDEESVFKARVKELIYKYSNYNRFENNECVGCMAKYVCKGCIGENYFKTGDVYGVSDDTCKMIKSVLRRLLINTAKIKLNG